MTSTNTMSHFGQNLKTWLVNSGSDSILSRSALRGYALSHGSRISFHDDYISIRKDRAEMRLSPKHMVCVPAMLQRFDLYMTTFVAEEIGGVALLDFSSPRVHKFKETQLEFYFPSIPEEGLDEGYTRWYRPQPGETVFDIGAHAGASTYSFSNMVGPAGTVYAFEPDETNFRYLLKNIEKHNMTNVIPVRKAISGTTGSLPFTMNGTIGSGLREFLLYPDTGATVTVECLTIADACKEFGICPSFMKIDIEGAELHAISGALEFLAANGIAVTLDTNHVVGGDLTYKRIEELFRSIGYEAKSSDEYGGLWTTWARPPFELRNTGSLRESQSHEDN